MREMKAENRTVLVMADYFLYVRNYLNIHQRTLQVLTKTVNRELIF